jgi:hypothetical protein
MNHAAPMQPGPFCIPEGLRRCGRIHYAPGRLEMQCHFRVRKSGFFSDLPKG